MVLLHGCAYKTVLTAYPLVLEEAIDGRIDLSCDVAICGVDNNPARIAASQYFRARKLPVIFTAVSADADHGYVFVQERGGACFGCIFPDAVDSRAYACPATPAIADILQAVGAFAVYAVDTVLWITRERGITGSYTYRIIRGIPVGSSANGLIACSMPIEPVCFRLSPNITVTRLMYVCIHKPSADNNFKFPFDTCQLCLYTAAELGMKWL
jgi:hypothetical protein